MKVLVLYRPNSEHGRLIEDFIRDFRERVSASHLEVLNVDSREGSAMASLYDVMEYPAILVIAYDGVLQKCWVGQQIPLLDEVTAYARA
jgi:hypothetical protein